MKKPKPTGSVRADAGKPPLSLVPRELVRGAARAYAFGAEKYSRYNYRQSGLAISRLTDSTLRHLVDFADGGDVDAESGLAVLDHAAASLGMLMDTLARVRAGKLPAELDDRWKEPT